LFLEDYFERTVGAVARSSFTGALKGTMLAPADIRAGKGQISYFEEVRMERMVKRGNTEVGIADLFKQAESLLGRCLGEKQFVLRQLAQYHTQLLFRGVD
jgi:hypothetical protein